MSIILEKVREDEKTILRNLYSLYLHDLSAFTTKLDIGADGLFEYEELELFWRTEGLSPYFIKNNENIVGFLLLIERPFLTKEYDFGINDLFILNKYRGKGLAKIAVEKVFQEKQGKYFIIELKNNRPAVAFWKKLFNTLNIRYKEREKLIDDEVCYVQSFQIEKSNNRIDYASKVIKASPEKIYKAFLDPEAVVLWLPPNDMRGHMFEFEAKAGGNYRMSLSYIGEEYANKGKTSENTDVIKGAFKEFVLNERIIQLVEFESEDPIFAGEMQMTWKLEQDPKGTLVSIACEHVPEGIKKEDHEIGLRSTLENLANYVETSREMV